MKETSALCQAGGYLGMCMFSQVWESGRHRLSSMPLVIPFCSLSPWGVTAGCTVCGLAGQNSYWMWQFALLGLCLLAQGWQLLSTLQPFSGGRPLCLLDQFPSCCRKGFLPSEPSELSLTKFQTVESNSDKYKENKLLDCQVTGPLTGWENGLLRNDNITVALGSLVAGIHDPILFWVLSLTCLLFQS